MNPVVAVADAVRAGFAFGRELVAFRREGWKRRYEQAVLAAKMERARRLADRIARAARDSW